MSRARPILVIGNSGQMAKALVEVGGENIIALGRPHIDLTRAADLERTIDHTKPALVINAAAFTAVDDAERHDKSAFALNCHGPQALAELCTSRQLPLIHLSTDYVFDGQKSTPYEEADTPNPISVYGRSKYAGETAIGQTHPHHIIVRTAWVHSAVGKNFVKTMLNLAKTRDTVSVVADQFGNPTYAPHLAQALLQIATKILDDPGFEQWGIYHLAGAGCTNWADFAKFIYAQSALLGGPTASVLPIASAQFPTPAPRPENSQLNTDKSRRQFGITMPDWQDGVRAGVARILANAETNFKPKPSPEL